MNITTPPDFIFIPPLFVLPGSTSSDAGKVAFWGRGPQGQQGIYLSGGGASSVVADLDTAIPGGTGNFLGFTELEPFSFGEPIVSLAGGSVVFWGRGSGAQQGIYLHDGATMRVVANENTPIPAGTGNFASFRAGFSTDGRNTAFVGEGSEVGGVYLDTAGSLGVVADENTPIPEGTGNFLAFGGVAVDAGAVAFVGGGSGGQAGIYLFDGQSLSVVVNQNTTIPGGGVMSFFGLTPEGLDDGVVGFSAEVIDPNHGILRGVFLKEESSITTVDVVNSGMGLPIPPFGLLGNITSPSVDGEFVAYRRGTILFGGLLVVALEDAVYLYDGQEKRILADLNTSIPSQPCLP
jgi:hypothetical protein